MTLRKLLLPRRGQAQPPHRDDGPFGFVEFAGWWAAGALWVDGWLTTPPRDPLATLIDLGEEPATRQSRAFSYSRPELHEIPDAAGIVLILPIAAPEPDRLSLRALHVEQAGEWYRWTRHGGLTVVDDLVAHLGRKLPRLSGETRAELCQFAHDVSALDLGLDPQTDSIFRRNVSAMEELQPTIEAGIGFTGSVPPHSPAGSAEFLNDDELSGKRQPGAGATSDTRQAMPFDAGPGDDSGAHGDVGEGDEDAETPADEKSEPPHETTAGADDAASCAPLAAGDEAWSRPAASPIAPAPTSQVAHPSAIPTEAVPTDWQPLPPSSANVSDPLGLHVDNLIRIDGASLVVTGWLWDVEGVVTKLDLTVADGGYRKDLLKTMTFVQRQDVCEHFRPSFGAQADGDHGFFAFVAQSPAAHPSSYVLEVHTRHGQVLQIGMPNAVWEPFAARDRVLSTLPETLPREWSLIKNHLHPALVRLQARCRFRSAIARSFEHGVQPRSPTSSLIIPLYGRPDHLPHQLAEFADDPDLRDCELIYVLDSPAHEATFEKDAFHLARLYDLPLRGLVLSRHTGYAAAVRLAAERARSRRLVLMHSDVLADRPGWLTRLEEFYDARPKIGTLGPKLLYEDQSLQHAGLFFTRDDEPDGLWTARSYFHALPRHLPAAAETRRVPALSGACMMIRRDLFERLGGLRDNHIAGDLEDVDLCLRCAESGFESWYLPTAELYHLAGSSQPSGPGWRRNPWSRLYNRWLLTQVWDTTIRKVMDELV